MPPVDRAIRAAATAAVVVLALVGFSVSYADIYEFPSDSVVAQLYPVTVDRLLVCAGLVDLAAWAAAGTWAHIVRVRFVAFG